MSGVTLDLVGLVVDAVGVVLDVGDDDDAVDVVIVGTMTLTHVWFTHI